MPEQPVPVFEEPRMLAGGELVARTRQSDVDDLDDAPGVGLERHHAVAEIDRLLEIVGDEQHGLTLDLAKSRDLVLQRLTRHRIERAERLVHQQQPRALRQCARDLHALLHAARELEREFCGMIGEADDAEQPAHLGRALGTRSAARLEREQDVARHRAPGQQRTAVVLEHDRELGGGPLDRASLEARFAFVRADQARRHAQQRGLPAARRADQANEFLGRDIEADGIEHRPALAEAHADSGE